MKIYTLLIIKITKMIPVSIPDWSNNFFYILCWCGNGEAPLICSINRDINWYNLSGGQFNIVEI